MDPSLCHAAEAAAAALAAGQADAHDLAILALARFDAGDAGAAEQLLDKALALGPHDPSVLVSLATIRRQQGRLRDAVLACDAALLIAPEYADAWRERGAVLAAGGSAANARASYAEAIRLSPADARALAGLAALHARDGDATQAAVTARAALAIEPGNLIAAGALASADLASGNAGGVPALLEPLIAALPDATSDRLFLFSVLGDAWHKLGEPDRAIAAWTASKADFAALAAAPPGSPLTHQQFVEAIRDGFAAADPAGWQAPLADGGSARPRHAFVLGYPRSGNTLVENILASLPGAAALEERPTLAETDRRYLSGDRAAIGQGLHRFGHADRAELEELRAAYWARVHAAGIAGDTELFVDMDPLKGTRLPFIARLFPDARIIVMRRDPRDVVLSCFRTNFALTSGTLEYTSIERAAAHYSALMELTEHALATLPLKVLEVHYHRLVADFDGTTQAICDFVGVPWDAAVRGFGQTAARRGVSTASAGQVTRGLYDGTRQWHPYAKWLEPALPMLQPWIDRFGYSD